MRHDVLEKIKKEIAATLTAYLREEGIELYFAANDNYPGPVVILERIDSTPLSSTKLLTEIKVMLSVLAKPWQCDTLIEGLYQCLSPYHITLPELTVLLMSLHVDTVQRVRLHGTRKQATIRYIVEEEQA